MSFRQYQRRLALQVFAKMCKYPFSSYSASTFKYHAIALYDKEYMAFDIVTFNVRSGDFKIDTISYEAVLGMRQNKHYPTYIHKVLLKDIWPKIQDKPYE